MIRDKDTKYTKLFVGGIPYSSDDDALRKVFSPYGEIVEAVVIKDRLTKKSKGYGFVTMATSDAAAQACKNKRPMIEGRQANVNLAYLGAKPKTAKIPGKLSMNPTYSFPQACGVSSAPQYVYTTPLYSPSQVQANAMSNLSIIPPQSPTQMAAQSIQQPFYVDYGGGLMVVCNAMYDPTQYYYQPSTTYVPSPTATNNVNQVFTFPTGPSSPPLTNGNGQAYIPTAPVELLGQVQCQ